MEAFSKEMLHLGTRDRRVCLSRLLRQKAA